MPRGAKPGDGRMVNAIAAAAAAKHARMLAELATGRKRCPRCCEPGQTLPLAEFGRQKHAPSGLHGWCRACVAADKRAKAKRNREAAAAAALERLRQGEQSRRDAAEAANPAYRAVRLMRERIERERAEAEALARWRRGLGPRPPIETSRPRKRPPATR